MTSPNLASGYRSHTVDQLGEVSVTTEISLAGALVKIHSGNELDLRDPYGTVRVELTDAGLESAAKQIVIDPDKPQLEHVLPPLHSIVRVVGRLRAGEPTRIKADEIEVLSRAKEPLLFDPDEPQPAYERIRHRYLYLRSEEMHRALAFRTRVLASLRKALDEADFLEVETPVLNAAYNPGQAGPFLAVRHPGKIYALPGSGSLEVPMLAASGFERAYQVIRHFRRQDSYGPFEQPEYSVLEVTCCYADWEDACSLVGRIFEQLVEDLGISLDTQRLTWAEAREQHGTATPDLREAAAVVDVSELAENSTFRSVRKAAKQGGLRATKVVDYHDTVPEEQLTELAADPGVDLVWLGKKHKRLWKHGTLTLDRRSSQGIADRFEADDHEVVLVAIAPDGGTASAVLRRAAALLRPDEQEMAHGLVEVTEMPYQQQQGNELQLAGDLLARPLDGDEDAEPQAMRAQAGQLVLDGIEIGQVAVRNHDLAQQRRLLKKFGLDALEVDARFGPIFEVLRYGVPPHVRVAIGVDRLVALLYGATGIDAVIPLPKQPDGTDPLVRSPWPIERPLVRSLLGQ